MSKPLNAKNISLNKETILFKFVIWKSVWLKGKSLHYILLFVWLGSLNKQRTVQKTELVCNNVNIKKLLFVPVLFKKFSDAIDSCDKFYAHSMADNFQVIWRKMLINLVDYLLIFSFYLFFRLYEGIINNKTLKRISCRLFQSLMESKHSHQQGNKRVLKWGKNSSLASIQI